MCFIQVSFFRVTGVGGSCGATMNDRRRVCRVFYSKYSLTYNSSSSCVAAAVYEVSYSSIALWTDTTSNSEYSLYHIDYWYIHTDKDKNSAALVCVPRARVCVVFVVLSIKGGAYIFTTTHTRTHAHETVKQAGPTGEGYKRWG